MSELITNLQTIYNTKLAIKQAIGTDSDNFVDYPSYISGMVTPTGYSYISTNGDYDISTYAMVNVNVSGGGTEYTWIDWGTSPVLTQGDKVSFNGYLGNGQQITQEIINVYPAFADYLGWYMYPVGGWDRSTTGTTPWEKYVLSENQLSISQNSGVVVYGEIVDITMGSATQKITILEDINETKYAGGNGTMNINTNGTQQVAGYKSVNVNVGVSLPEVCLVAIGDQGTTQIIEPDQNTGQCVLSIPIDFTAGSNVSLAENYSVFLIDHDLILPFYPSIDMDMSDWGNLASLGLVDGSELTVTYPQGRAFNHNGVVANFGIRPIYVGESDCPIIVSNELAEYYNDGNDYVLTFTVEMNNNNIWGLNILQK